MLDIQIRTVEINTDSAIPSLRINTELKYLEEIEFPITIGGTVKFQGGKTVGTLYEFNKHADDESGIYIFSDEGARSHKIGNDKERRYYGYFICDLSKVSIDYLEMMREKDNEKDVKLSFDFFVKSFQIPATPNPQSKTFESQTFLRIIIKSLTTFYTIKHSDWINKFAPHLGLGNFLLLDLQIPDEKEVDDFWIEMYDSLIHNIKEMETSNRNGDWPKTMNIARRYFETLKIGDNKSVDSNFKTELRKLFEADQHDEEGFQNFFDGVWKFFEFTSKFVHVKNKAGVIKPRPIPYKEDAYFVYALGIGLTNIIGRKINRESLAQ